MRVTVCKGGADDFRRCCCDTAHLRVLMLCEAAAKRVSLHAANKRRVQAAAALAFTYLVALCVSAVSAASSTNLQQRVRQWGEGQGARVSLTRGCP